MQPPPNTQTNLRESFETRSELRYPSAIKWAWDVPIANVSCAALTTWFSFSSVSDSTSSYLGSNFLVPFWWEILNPCFSPLSNYLLHKPHPFYCLLLNGWKLIHRVSLCPHTCIRTCTPPHIFFVHLYIGTQTDSATWLLWAQPQDKQLCLGHAKIPLGA